MKENKVGKWGGKRAGAGRKPKQGKKATPTTKVIRVPMRHYARFKSGRYDELMSLLYDYRTRLESSKEAHTSPRWQQMREFLAEVDVIFGSDYDSWLDDD